MLFTAGLSMLDLIQGINEDGKVSESRQEPLSDSEKSRRWQVLMITVGLIVAFHNDGIGVLGGCLVHLIFKLQDRWQNGAVQELDDAEERLLL